MVAVPQIGLDEPYDAEPVDIWGIGVILFTLLAGSSSTSICRLFDSRHDYGYARYALGRAITAEPRILSISVWAVLRR